MDKIIDDSREIREEGYSIKNLLDAKEHKKVLKSVPYKADVNGNLIFKLGKNIEGIMLRNDVSYKLEKNGNVHIDMVRRKIGVVLEFYVNSIKEENGKIIAFISRKELIEKERDNILSNIKIGDKVKGVVTAIQPFGAFINIGGDIEGLITIDKISRVYIREPGEILKPGDEVEVLVIRLENNQDNVIVGFNRKDLTPGWEVIDERFKIGETVIGTVKNEDSAGIFVALDDSFEGLANFVEGRKYKYGDEVRVKITYINKQKKKIKLRIIE